MTISHEENRAVSDYLYSILEGIINVVHEKAQASSQCSTQREGEAETGSSCLRQEGQSTSGRVQLIRQDTPKAV